MTVVRSLAFQNARKSTGQSTYYRRKGVQLVRSKPTFAPGRTFTQKQVNCQQAMRLARLCVQQFNMQSLIDVCNVSNVKRYNASTQINRMVSNIINDNKNVIDARGLTADAMLRDYTLSCASSFNKGDIELNMGHMRVTSVMTENVPIITCDVAIPTILLNQMLSNATKRARSRTPYTIDNIGFCGLIKTDPDNIDQMGTVVPSWMESYSELDFDHYTTLTFSAPIIMNMPPPDSPIALGYYMLFVYSQKGTTNEVTGGKSIYTMTPFYAECETLNQWQDIPT